MNTEHNKTLTELCESIVAVCQQIQASSSDADRVMKSATVVWLAEQIDQKAREVVRRKQVSEYMGQFDRMVEQIMEPQPVRPSRLSFLDACKIVYP